jgi:hypothetical protein
VDYQKAFNTLFRKIQLMEKQHLTIVNKYEDLIEALNSRPRSITEELDSIEGRRIFFNLTDRISFTAQEDGLRGNPLSFLVSQDGPFIMTHYPLVAWKPNAPVNADSFGQWSPVASWPLPVQQSTNQDSINLSYEFTDGGSQRNFNNEAAAPLFSRPDNAVPLPTPTMFSPNSVMQFYPTYEDIFFNGNAQVPATGGELVVTLPGYRVANM